MSKDNLTFNANLEFLAAHLLIDLASIAGARTAGDPVSDEELAIMVEPDAAVRLDQARIQQIMVQIASSQRLFEQWHLLTESRVLDGSFAEQMPASLEAAQSNPGENRRGLFDSFLIGWQSLFQPGWSFATAGSLLMFGFFSGYMILSPQNAPLVVSNGYDQPQRASVADVQQSALPGTNRVRQSLQCVDAIEARRVCYSGTVGAQHWFLEAENKVVAVSKPVEADRVTALRVYGNSLLVESVVGEQFQLNLFTVDYAAAFTGSDWRLATVHQDTIEGGYFDELLLTENSLSYKKSKAGTDPVPVEIDYVGNNK